MSEIEIVVADERQAVDVEEELRSLLRWLREDETLAQAARARLGSSTAPAPGSMGAAFDVLQLVIASGLSSGSLAVSILQWRDARRLRPALRIRRGDIEMDIPVGGDTDSVVEAVTRLLAGALPAGGTGTTGGADGADGSGGTADGGTAENTDTEDAHADSHAADQVDEHAS